MKFFIVGVITSCLFLGSFGEETRLIELEPDEAAQIINKQDQSLRYASKIESNVPGVRFIGDHPEQVVQDIYLANQYHGQDGLGAYVYGYSIPDIAKTEKKERSGDLKGAYNYIAEDGQEIKVQYWDDGTGFHQIDNIPQIQPKQVEDSPEVKAAKEEHLRIWHEQAERNSHAPADPYENQYNQPQQPIQNQYQQYQGQVQYQPNPQTYSSQNAGATLHQAQAHDQAQVYGQAQAQGHSQSQGHSHAQVLNQAQGHGLVQDHDQAQAYGQSQGYGVVQGHGEAQGQSHGQALGHGQAQVYGQIHGHGQAHVSSHIQGQHKAGFSQHHGQAQTQHSAPVSPNSVEYSGQYSANQPTRVYGLGDGQYGSDQYQHGSSGGYQTTSQGSRGGQQVGNQSSGKQSHQEEEEQTGPPKGFFYSFDYAVPIIVGREGKNLEAYYNQNKNLYEKQLTGGAPRPAGASSSYHASA